MKKEKTERGRGRKWNERVKDKGEWKEGGKEERN